MRSTTGGQCQPVGSAIHTVRIPRSSARRSKWQPVIAVGSMRGQIAHHAQHAALHGTIDRDLAIHAEVSASTEPFQSAALTAS